MPVAGSNSAGDLDEADRILALMLVLGAPWANLSAQKLYRCGNVFQERPCEGPKPAPAADEVPKQSGPSAAVLEKRKQIRCENFQRQVTELVGREKAEKNAQLLKGWVEQRKGIEDQMKADSCQ